MSNADYFTRSENVTELRGNSFSDDASELLKNEMCLSAVLFYAPWCPHCKDTAPIWNKLAKTVTFAKLYAVNIEAPETKEFILRVRETHPHIISSYPTIWFYVNGKAVEKFDSTSRKRSFDTLLDDLKRLKVKCS